MPASTPNIARTNASAIAVCVAVVRAVSDATSAAEILFNPHAFRVLQARVPTALIIRLFHHPTVRGAPLTRTFAGILCVTPVADDLPVESGFTVERFDEASVRVFDGFRRAEQRAAVMLDGGCVREPCGGGGDGDGDDECEGGEDGECVAETHLGARGRMRRDARVWAFFLRGKTKGLFGRRGDAAAATAARRQRLSRVLSCVCVCQ